MKEFKAYLSEEAWKALDKIAAFEKGKTKKEIASEILLKAAAKLKGKKAPKK